MAKIEIPDSMVPEGWEIDCDRAVSQLSGIFPPCNLPLLVPVRRKLRLKKIVFTVAGEPRLIKTGEWRLLADGSPDIWTPDGTTANKYIPLTREEVYE